MSTVLCAIMENILTCPMKTHQNRKSQNQPSNVSEFSKALFSHFSVHKLLRISKLIAWNRYLALEAAITSQCDVTSVILTSP